ELFRQRIGDDAADDVDGGPRRERHDGTDDFIAWPVREGSPREGGRGERGRGELQESAAADRHGLSPVAVRRRAARLLCFSAMMPCAHGLVRGWARLLD